MPAGLAERSAAVRITNVTRYQGIQVLLRSSEQNNFAINIIHALFTIILSHRKILSHHNNDVSCDIMQTPGLTLVNNQLNTS